MRRAFLLAAALVLAPSLALAQAVQYRAADGLNNTPVSAAAPLPVTMPAGASGAAKAEDAASADGDVGTAVLCTRKATPANTSGTDGDYEFLECSAGRLWTSATIDAALPAGTNLIGSVNLNGLSASHITTNATTTPKSAAGVLHTICINTKGASANTATVYDNTAASGTVIAVLDTTTAVGCLTYDVAFGTGLTVVTATGTAPDMTVTYR